MHGGWTQGDVAARLVQNMPSEADLMVGGEVHAQARGAPSLSCNTGTLLLRVGAWSERFLEAWWAHPEAAEGKPDHAVLDAMFRKNTFGLRHRLKVEAMHAMNDGLGTFKLPSEQPVLHMIGTSSELKSQVRGNP